MRACVAQRCTELCLVLQHQLLTSVVLCTCLVKKLLGWGANPNFRDKNGETPLHKAAFGNYPAVCTALLDAGAMRDIPNQHSQMAMDLTEDRATRFALAPPQTTDEPDQMFEQVCFGWVE